MEANFEIFNYQANKNASSMALSSYLLERDQFKMDQNGLRIRPNHTERVAFEIQREKQNFVLTKLNFKHNPKVTILL